MKTQIGKWGNSYAVRIPGTYAKELELEEGMEVEVTRVDEGLLVSPLKREYTLEELLEKITRRTSMAKRTGEKPSAAKHGKTPNAPDAGDLIWLSFSPQAGRAQATRRPGSVVSPRVCNAKVGHSLVCPITHPAKGYAFEVELPTDLPVRGVVPADHV
jgi:antitoxin component of MazEF toxin-antitoxin module